MQTQTRRLPRLMVHQQAGQARQTTQPRRRTTQGRAHTRGREAREVHRAAGRGCAGRGRVPEQGVQQPLPPCPHAPGHTNLGQPVRPAAQVHVRRPPLPHSLGGGVKLPPAACRRLPAPPARRCRTPAPADPLARQQTGAQVGAQQGQQDPRASRSQGVGGREHHAAPPK